MVFIGMPPKDREKEVEENIQKYRQKFNFPISIQTA